MIHYKKIKTTQAMCLLSIAITGCRSLYTPTTPNVPLFKEKNEFQIEATHFFNGLNVKTAYTPVNHFAFQINGQFSQSLDKPNPDRNYHKYLEAALGYYHCFKDTYVLECYGGYGKGASVFSDGLFSNETLLVSAKGYYEKYYLQLNFGTFKAVKNGRMGVCIRIGNVRYSYTDANLRSLINTTADHYTLEPYWFMNLRLSKRLFFTTNGGITIIQGLSNYPYQATMRTSVINIGVGLRFSLGIYKNHKGEDIIN